MTLSNSEKIEHIYNALVKANDSLELWRQSKDPELELAIKYANDLRKLDLNDAIDPGDD
jgi:hypothetical protein